MSMQFLSSRPPRPIPFRVKRSNSNSLSIVDLSPLKWCSAILSDSSSHVVAHLEKAVDGKEDEVIGTEGSKDDEVNGAGVP
jgi:hypothetical protein